jgi:putative sterol carrier protein
MAFASDALFAALKAGVDADGAALVPKIKGIYLFNVTNAGAKKEWTINLKSGNGSVSEGKQGKPDVTLTVSDADFCALADGKANPQQLFMQGKIKMVGNMALAMKLEQV